MKTTEKVVRKRAGEILLDISRGLRETRTALEALQKRMDGVEGAVQKRDPATTSLPGVDAKKFSFARAVYAIASKDWSRAGYEQEVFTQMRKKVASLNDDQNLGNLVPAEVRNEIIPMLRSRLVLGKIGVTMLDDLAGSPVEIPREIGGGTGYWVGENDDITESDTATDVLRLRPHKAGALVKLSNTLLRIGGARIEGFVRNSIAQTLARTIQKAVINGTGTSGQPLGILNNPNINTVPTIGTVTTVKLQRMIEEIEADDADIGTLYWLFHPRAKAKILQLAKSAGASSADQEPVFFPGSPTAGEPATILGIPFATTTDMPYVAASTSDIMLGVFSEVMLGHWGTMELKASQETSTAFQKDQTWIRAIEECDVGLRHEPAICAGPGLTVN